MPASSSASGTSVGALLGYLIQLHDPLLDTPSA